MALERRGAIMPERMEKFAKSELGVTLMGGFMGAILHMISESLFDSFLETKYPEKYPVYSTGIAATIFTSVGLGMLIYGWRAEYPFFQYLGGGMVFAEVVQWLDMVRVSFEIAR